MSSLLQTQNSAHNQVKTKLSFSFKKAEGSTSSNIFVLLLTSSNKFLKIFFHSFQKNLKSKKRRMEMSKWHHFVISRHCAFLDFSRNIWLYTRMFGSNWVYPIGPTQIIFGYTQIAFGSTQIVFGSTQFAYKRGCIFIQKISLSQTIAPHTHRYIFPKLFFINK